jgi:hypothetical protein
MNKPIYFFMQSTPSQILLFLVVMIGLSACVHQSSQTKSSVPAKETASVEQESLGDERGWNLEFSEDFSDVKIGTEPDSLFILDGAYTVQAEQSGDKSLSLPGSPMGDFGLLFGPREKEKNLELSFSFFASKKGRRMPSIAAGIGGIRGYRIRLNPAAKNIVLSLDEMVLKEIPFSWTGGQWWKLRFQALTGDSSQTTRLQFKLWSEKNNEPKDWILSEQYDVEYVGGKCALWGFPYSSMPILFDNIEIRSN